MNTSEYVKTGLMTTVARVKTRLTRGESRKRTRELLVDSAATVFANRGYHSASVDEIAEHAGFSKGAVYANFPTKEQLFLAVMDRHQQVQEQSFQGMRQPDKSATAAMAELAEVAAPTDPDAWRWGLLTLEFFLYAVRQPALRAELAKRFETSRSQLANSLEPHCDGQAPPVLTAAELAIIALAVSTGLGVQAVLDHTSIPPDLYQRTMTRLLA
jgi:AcrR family transcriptional regulator